MRSRLIRRVVVIVTLLFCTITAGTLGFRVLEGYTWFEAFYRTLTTITTVGDPQAAALSHMGRVFNALLILFGVSAMFLAVGAMTQTIIESTPTAYNSTSETVRSSYENFARTRSTLLSASVTRSPSASKTQTPTAAAPERTAQ